MDYKLLETPADWQELDLYSTKSSFVVLDTETTGLDAYAGDKPFLLQILFEARPTICYLIPFQDFGTQLDPYRLPKEQYELNKQKTKALLERILKLHIDIAGHNLKFDLHMLFVFLEIPFKKTSEVVSSFVDTMYLARAADNSHFSYSLDNCSKHFKLDVKKIGDAINDWTSANKKQWDGTYDTIPASLMLQYSYIDVFTTFDLLQKLKAEFDAISRTKAKPQNVYDWITLIADMTKICFFMERRGFNVNKKLLAEIETEVDKVLEPKKLQYFFQAESDFVSSPESLAPAIKAVTGKELYKSPSGRYSASEEVLKRMEHPFCDLILEIRALDKLKSSFINPLKESTKTNCTIRSSINVLGAKTYRQSSYSPNLQQQPASKILGKYDFREVFYCDGYKIAACDLSASQARLAAALSNETDLINAILNKEDLHALNAQKMGCDRKTAKGAFFAMLFGGGAGAIASSLGISIRKAEIVLNSLRRATPNITAKSNKLIHQAQNYGYILNHYGVPLYVPIAKNAFNMLIQSTEAILFYKIVRDVDRLCNHLGYIDIVLTVHDEIVLRVKTGYEEQFAKDKVKIEECFSLHFESNCVTMEGEMSELKDFWSK